MKKIKQRFGRVALATATFWIADLALAQEQGPALVSTQAVATVTNAALGLTNLAGVSNAPLALATNALAATVTNEPSIVEENGTNGLRFNFRGAPLNLVLDHLAEAAGFIINKQTEVRGSLEVWSKGPVTQDEAVDILLAALRKNGYALTRKGRLLTITALDSIKTADLEVTTPYEPDKLEAGDDTITAIIHVRYANASQLRANLELLLPTSATLTANEGANSLLLVATKTDIKRMLKIINAFDLSIVSSIKVFPLKFADAKDTATLLTQLFNSQGANQNASNVRANVLNPMPPFGGGPGGGGGPGAGPGGDGNGGGGASSTRAHLLAVPDDRSNSVVCSAPDDVLCSIEDLLPKIDQEVTDQIELRVFHLANADPSETADQLTALFPDPTASSNGQQSNNNMPFFMPGPGAGNPATAANNSNDRLKKLSRVTAVPDPRTSSLLVSASRTAMPEIEKMIQRLDADPGRREIVGYYELRNADPQDVLQALTDLFNRSGVRMQNNNNNSDLGSNSALNRRKTSNAQGTSTANNSNGMGAMGNTSQNGTPGL